MNKKNNITLDIIAIVLGVISMAYYIGLKMAYGKIAFSIVFFIVGLIIFAYGLLEFIFKINLWSKVPKVFRRIITILFVIGLVFFIFVEGVIFYEGHHKDSGKADYLMVLGAGIRGEMVTTVLAYRLDTAIEYNKENPDVKIIVSGGQGPGEDVTEAYAMKKYLMEGGVDENLIITEDKSTSTYENFEFTKEILEKEYGKKDYTIMVVTNNFHMFRAKFFGKQAGFKTLGYPAPTHISTTLNFHIREFFGVIKAYILNR